MSMVWDKMIPLSESIIDRFKECGILPIESKYEHTDIDFTWKNYLFESDKFRRAHIEIVDARKSKKMWVMHMTIFPHLNDPAPIFGFDVVCGANKITGAFHDFSKSGDSVIYDWYQNKMAAINWTKPRELPDWAKRIFSPGMLAAGNVSTEEELDKLIGVAIDNIDYFLYNVGNEKDDNSYIEQYNNYCINQKLNHHTLVMMVNLGVDENNFKNFMDEILFPEIK